MGCYPKLVLLVDIPALLCFASWQGGQEGWQKRERDSHWDRFHESP